MKLILNLERNVILPKKPVKAANRLPRLAAEPVVAAAVAK